MLLYSGPKRSKQFLNCSNKKNKNQECLTKCGDLIPPHPLQKFNTVSFKQLAFFGSATKRGCLINNDNPIFLLK
jgi:hypothetical protein